MPTTSITKAALHGLFALLLLLLAGCTEGTDGPVHPEADSIRVGFTLAASGGTNGGWVYKNGEGDEFIQQGFCVMVNAETMKVEHLFFTKDNGQNVPYGNVTTASGSTYITTTVGRKLFYTFANLTQDEVESAVRSSNASAADFHMAEDEALDTALLARTNIAVSADGFTPTRAKGIPMSGMQQITLAPSDNNQVRTLSVVRMVGKLQFDLTNGTASPLTVQSVTLDALSDNPADGEANLRLLPSVTPTVGDGANVTIMPRLTPYGLAHHSAHTYPVGRTLQSGQSTTVTVYCNETAAPNTRFNRFLLTVQLLAADGTTTSQRYSLLSDNLDDWSFVARNDWRRIPVTFHDYRFELIPQDFPPIGVLPCSVKETDGTFTCTFRSFGDFHLIPRITNRATGQIVKGWTPEGVTWTTVTPNDALYATVPYWYATGSYVHGTFRRGQTGQSTHILTLEADPEGVTARTFVAPVIINRVAD